MLDFLMKGYLGDDKECYKDILEMLKDTRENYCYSYLLADFITQSKASWSLSYFGS